MSQRDKCDRCGARCWPTHERAKINKDGTVRYLESICQRCVKVLAAAGQLPPDVVKVSE